MKLFYLQFSSYDQSQFCGLTRTVATQAIVVTMSNKIGLPENVLPSSYEKLISSNMTEV